VVDSVNWSNFCFLHISFSGGFWNEISTYTQMICLWTLVKLSLLQFGVVFFCHNLFFSFIEFLTFWFPLLSQLFESGLKFLKLLWASLISFKFCSLGMVKQLNSMEQAGDGAAAVTSHSGKHDDFKVWSESCSCWKKGKFLTNPLVVNATY
jgi:hypothetical protein